jgi:hypothetical protein
MMERGKSVGEEGEGNLLVVTTIMDSLMFAILDMRLHTGASQTSLTDSQMRWRGGGGGLEDHLIRNIEIF